MEITLLDLFSGIGGFSLGLERAGFKIKNHYNSEIDQHASAVYKHNFPNSKNYGSVVNIRGNQLPSRPNIITFGSPCQDFSLAGKRKGMEGERSSLITQAIRLITETRPELFIWENVKGTFSSNNGADFWAIIKAFTNIGGYRFEWQLLNTSWFLPQNRERIYLVGHLAETSGPCVFPIQENDGLFNQKDPTNRGQSQAKRSATTLKSSGAIKADDTFISTCLSKSSSGMTATDTFIDVSETAKTLTGGGNSGGLHSDMSTVKVKSGLKNGYEIATTGDVVDLQNIDSETRRGRVQKGKAKTLDTGCQQGIITAISTPSRKTKNQNGSRFKDDGAFCLDTQEPQGEAIGTQIRRLTEIECERLQGFPDNWTSQGNYNGESKPVSKTQRYKQLGNAVTVDVVEAIGIKLIKNKIPVK